jgi:hypothetical protein
LSGRHGGTPILQIFHEKCQKWCTGVPCIYTDAVFHGTWWYTTSLNSVNQYLFGGVPYVQ